QQDEAGRPAREPGKAPGAPRRRGPEPRGCPREVIGRAVAAAGGRDSPPRPRRPPPPFFFRVFELPPRGPRKRKGRSPPGGRPFARSRPPACSGLGGGLLLLLRLLGLGRRFLLRGRLLLRRRGRRVRILLLEPVDAALGVDQLLLAGEEGMAVAADVEVQVAVGGPRLPGGAAGAVDLGGGVGGVDVFAHVYSFGRARGLLAQVRGVFRRDEKGASQ